MQICLFKHKIPDVFTCIKKIDKCVILDSQGQGTRMMLLLRLYVLCKGWVSFRENNTLQYGVL